MVDKTAENTRPLNKALSAFSNAKERTIVVTGGTYGIGRMMAEAFASAGASVIICARKAEACKQVAEEITHGSPGKCIGIAADLSKSNGITALATAVEGNADQIHTLINNAGTPLIAPIDEYPEEGWDNVFDLNLKAAFFLVQRLLPLLRRGVKDDWPASIINIGSIAGVQIQQRENYAYAASKAGLHYLTKSLAKHLGPEGITVNAVAPGLFLTEMTREHAAAADQFIQRTPLRRLGEASDIADLVCFLASPSASYLTGATIPIDGGASI